ncbi:hypothetical protein RRG08_050087 [Elysia crispata]|uniref:Uncharacterized protein n=1 Tax=Elysia crispata TaxID=231223 RepID=A0AAE0YUP1_9GAST|nr:hypothetical protein RRG08_050087 [Elysia crispata]
MIIRAAQNQYKCLYDGAVSSWPTIPRTFPVMLQMYPALPDKVRWCHELAHNSQNVYCNVTDVSSASRQCPMVSLAGVQFPERLL